MIQMTLTKNNLEKLGLNVGHLVQNRFGRLSRGLEITLGVTLSSNESYSGERGSLAFPSVNFGEAYTNECTGDANIFSVAIIPSESFIDTMFVELSGIG